MEKAVHSLIERVSSLHEIDSFQQILDTIRNDLELDHFAYLCIRVPRAGVNDPFTICSYSNEWVSHYQNAGYLNIDPVVAAGKDRIIPFDWSEFNSNRKHKRFFSEAINAGIGQNGLTIPIRGIDGEFAMVNFSSTMNNNNWEKHTLNFRHTMHLFSFYYHSALVENVLSRGKSKSPPSLQLTPREIECLHWAAAGKTAWETSNIIKISERTVVFHMENAKSKLGVSTKNHAVVKAIMMGIISP